MSGGLNNQGKHASIVCCRSVKTRFRRQGRLCTAQRPLPTVSCGRSSTSIHSSYFLALNMPNETCETECSPKHLPLLFSLSLFVESSTSSTGRGR